MHDCDAKRKIYNAIINKMFFNEDIATIRINDIYKIFSEWKNDLSMDKDAFLFVYLSMDKLKDFSDALFHFHDRKYSEKTGAKVQKILRLLFEDKDNYNQTLKNIISKIYDKAKQYMVCISLFF